MLYRDPAEFESDDITLKCPKCNGSGTYYGRGRVENGVFIGVTGKCFACHGTGFQTKRDAYRCQTYWNKYAHLGD